MRISQRFVETPEILGIVCKLSEDSDQARLLRVSQLFFDIAAPVVWESVTGVHNLLALLPGVVSGTGTPAPVERTIVCTFAVYS